MLILTCGSIITSGLHLTENHSIFFEVFRKLIIGLIAIVFMSSVIATKGLTVSVFIIPIAVYLLWLNQIKVKTYINGTWIDYGPVVGQLQGNDNHNILDISINANNDVYVAFCDASTYAMNSIGEVWVSVKKYNGSQWLDVGYAAGAASDFNPARWIDLEFDSNNIPHLAFSHQAVAGHPYVAKYNDNLNRGIYSYNHYN